MWTRYVALGDSITEGYGDPVDGERLRSWTDWLADDLTRTSPGLAYRNLGLRASTCRDVLLGQIPAAVGAEPDLVTLTVGANDALGPDWSVARFRETFARTLEPLMELGADVVTYCYPDVGPQLAHAGHRLAPAWATYVERTRDANDAIRGVSAGVGALVLNYERFSPLLDPANISADRIHPNARGYRLAAHEALTRLLAHYAAPRAPSPS